MSSRSRLRWGRLLAAAAGALALGYLLYLVGANWFLQSALLDRVINDRPERLRIAWSRARTWWPGLVALEGVTIDGANQRFEWAAQLDRVGVELSLAALPRKVFRTRRIAGQGLGFRLARRAEAGGATGSEPGAVAGREEAPAGEAATARRDRPHRDRPHRDRSRRRPWRLDLRGIRIGDVREIAIEDLSYLGEGQLSGALEHEIRGPLGFDELTLAAARARLLHAGELVADEMRFALAVSAEPFVPGEDPLREVLGGVTGELALAADVESIGALDYLVRRPDWLSIAGAGRLDTRFAVREGRVVPGGHLDFAARTLEAGALDWTAAGAGTIAVRLPEGGSRARPLGEEMAPGGESVASAGGARGAGRPASDPAAELDLRFDRFAVRHRAQEVAHVRGEGLRVAVGARTLDLEEGFGDLELRVDLPPSRVDFVAYNAYLPQGALRIDRGVGTLRSWFEYTERSRDGRGEVAIEVEAAAGRFGELGLEGDVKLLTSIRGGDFAARSFDVTGSSLELSNVRITGPEGRIESEGWWATLAAGSAHLDMKEPLGAGVSLHGRLRDAKPVLAALATRKKWLFWLDEVVGVRDLAGRVQLEVDGPLLRARQLDITGDRLEIQGEIELDRGAREGLLYLKYGPLSAAVEIAPEEREWKLLHAWRWFDDKRRERRRLEGRE